MDAERIMAKAQGGFSRLASEISGWVACAISALPVTIVMASAGRWILGPSAIWPWLYPAVFGLWVWRARPWIARSD